MTPDLFTVLEPHPAEKLEAWANSSVKTDAKTRMIETAMESAKIRAEFEGGFFAWELALDMAKAGLIDGTESRDGFGSIGTRLGMKATKEYHRVPTELPREFRLDHRGNPVSPERVAVMEKIIAASHSNRCTWWRPPPADERGEQVERAKRKRRKVT